ncbi:MAG TPA: hypothetical protein VFP54_08095 [Acidimicrobiales bacterium]|nr:hypothetical protein [Acidimicrobiales bacterium]
MGCFGPHISGGPGPKLGRRGGGEPFERQRGRISDSDKAVSARYPQRTGNPPSGVGTGYDHPAALLLNVSYHAHDHAHGDLIGEDYAGHVDKDGLLSDGGGKFSAQLAGLGRGEIAL